MKNIIAKTTFFIDCEIGFFFVEHYFQNGNAHSFNLAIDGAMDNRFLFV